jgi:hypothetical protein
MSPIGWVHPQFLIIGSRKGAGQKLRIGSLLVWMFKSSCIGTEVKDTRLFHFIAVIDAGSVPRHIINRHSGTRQAPRDFISDFFKVDGAIIVNPAPSFHPEQGFNVN